MPNKLTIFDFITRANKTHNNKYNYSLVDYINNKTKVKIICPDHGVFEQKPNDHLTGHGCSLCTRVDINDFIIKAKGVHGDKYSYDLVEYVNSKTKVKIICPIHGVFRQKPNNHLNGQCCPDCMRFVSHQEIEFTDYIKSLYNGTIITNTRSFIPPYEIDVYLPDKKIAFEYNGEYWHQEGVKVPMGYHQMKTDMCIAKGVELYHIWESDWVGNRDVVKLTIGDLICQINQK